LSDNGCQLGRLRPRSELTGVEEAVVALVADDEVIEHAQTEQLRGLDDALGDRAILRARRDVA
jgi:hypothetical protein